MEKDIRQLIEECKALVEQSEPFQKKMKAKHSRMKKEVIGHGGQKNTPPFTIKPSMKRSKSAPPIGEQRIDEELIKYLIEEGIWDKMKKAGLGVLLGATLAGVVGTGLAAKVSSDTTQAKEQSALQQQANTEKQELASIYNKYYNNLVKEHTMDMKVSKWQADIKANMKSNLHLNDNVIDLIMKDIGTVSKEGKPLNPYQAYARAANLATHAAKYEMQHKDDPNFKELNAIAYAMQQMEQQGIVNEHIVKKGSKYCLMSKKTNKNLGCYPTKAGAKKREKQVQYFKHAK